MAVKLTMEYWRESDRYAGRIREVAGVYAKADSVKELEANILKAFRRMLDKAPHVDTKTRTKTITIRTCC